jgi:hypothetical protein
LINAWNIKNLEILHIEDVENKKIDVCVKSNQEDEEHNTQIFNDINHHEENIKGWVGVYKEKLTKKNKLLLEKRKKKKKKKKEIE